MHSFSDDLASICMVMLFLCLFWIFLAANCTHCFSSSAFLREVCITLLLSTHKGVEDKHHTPPGHSQPKQFPVPVPWPCVLPVNHLFTGLSPECPCLSGSGEPRTGQSTAGVASSMLRLKVRIMSLYLLATLYLMQPWRLLIPFAAKEHCWLMFNLFLQGLWYFFTKLPSTNQRQSMKQYKNNFRNKGLVGRSWNWPILVEKIDIIQTIISY